MSFTDADDLITAWRDALLACAAVSALPMVSGNFHYPTLAVATASLPAAVLYDDGYGSERNGNGDFIGGGQMGAVFYFPVATFTVGQVEAFGRNVCDQLVGWTSTSLAIIRARRERASKPRRAAKAAAGDAGGIAYFTVRITADWQG